MYALDMARLGGHYEVARLLQALHWAADKDHHDNHVLLQTALQEEAAAMERERFAWNKRYRGVRAYEAWQEQNSVSNRSHVEPGACQFRQEQRVRLDSPGSSSCSSCRHSSATRSASRASRRPAVRPLNISSHQADKNLSHVGRPGQIYPYSNYPAQGDREYGRRTPSQGGGGGGPRRTPSQGGSGGGPRRTKLPFGIRKSARVCPPQPKTGETELRLSPSVTVVGSELNEGHCVDYRSGEKGVVEKEVEEYVDEEGLGSPGELTFHEVQQQSLKGVPDAIYLQELLGSQSPALQSPPVSKDRQRRLSMSQINHRHNVYRGKMHRRLSLGAIPEGRMVREYCEDDDDEDLLGSVLWNSVAWQVLLASQRQYSSAPPSPVSDAQRSVLNARILGRLGTAADEERELVYSDGSSSEEGDDEDEDEEGSQVPRPDTPLPSLVYSSLLQPPSPPNSSHSLSSPSSPRLTSPNPLENWEPSPDQAPSLTDEPLNQVPSLTDEPLDQVPSSTDEPPDQVPSSTDEPLDQVPSSTDEPLDQVPSSTDEPLDQVPSSTDEPPDQAPSSTDEPPDQVPSSTDEPLDQVPSSTDVPLSQVQSTEGPECPLSPVGVMWQDKTDIPSTARSTSLCVMGGKINPSSRSRQQLARSPTPQTPPKRESPRSRLPSRTSPLRSKSSAGIRGTPSAHRLSARQTQSSCTLPLSHSKLEGRVALQPTLMQFGGGLVSVTAGLR